MKTVNHTPPNGGGVSEFHLCNHPAKFVNCDLHIHSRFSGGTSDKMTVEMLSREAPKKGIGLIASGDCLHGKWFSEVTACEEVVPGTYELGGTRFILSAEVEAEKRTHHLLYFPHADAAMEFKEMARPFSPNLETDGRPNVNLSGEKIAEMAERVGALIGPAHAFTPWTSLYGAFDSLSGCYGGMADYVSLLELGLSADSDYADRIEEIRRLTFLTNSDCHSPYPLRLAREFNRMGLREASFESVKNAILRKGDERIILNVGLPPQEGKYNESACTVCFKHYNLIEAVMRKWRCTCGRIIKKGVRDRVEELATHPYPPAHPDYRPPYVHIIPLAEIIRAAFGLSSTYSKKVGEEWERLVYRFGNEVEVLVDAQIETIAEVASPKVAHAITAFRQNRVILHPGGGGDYGRVEIPENLDDIPTPHRFGSGHAGAQKSLVDYD